MTTPTDDVLRFVECVTIRSYGVNRVSKERKRLFYFLSDAANTSWREVLGFNDDVDVAIADLMPLRASK